MRSHRKPSRAGAALLVTLGTLVLTLAAITGVAALAASHKLEREFDRLGLMADDLLIAADEAILDWLRTESSRVVLPPEAQTPEVLILHDVWQPLNDSQLETKDAVEMELRITGWDQCGMVPLAMAMAGSPLRIALPEHVLHAIVSLEMTDEALIGLDRFAQPLESDSHSPFPLPEEMSDHEQLRYFGGAQTPQPPAPRLRSRRSGLTEEVAMGAFISTHTESMNLNTAPVAALEQALRQNGRGGIEVVVAARSAGTRASPGSLPVLGDSRDSSLRLVGTSDAWAFRIDARAGAVQRSWWAIYKPATSASTTSPSSARRSASGGGGGSVRVGGWECVQRMVIRD